MKQPSVLRLGTRGSALAWTQSGQVAAALTKVTGIPVERVAIRTRGDDIHDRPLAAVGGKGLFTKEIELALLNHDIDFAVHSMKDLPSETPAGLMIGAIPRRYDPRDVLIGATLQSLPTGAIIGTGSARRTRQLLDLRPDLEIRGIRGNVDTRIQKQQSGEFAAILLAAAGLIRLGRENDITDYLSVETMIPAPGQGALAVQCRCEDVAIQTLLQTIHDFETAIAIEVERAFLMTISGGCSVPAACFARQIDSEIEVLASYSPPNQPTRRAVVYGMIDHAADLGKQAAHAVYSEVN